MPTVSLVPLVRSLRAWLALPSPSRWLIRTIRLGYAIQFARRPPKFRGVHFTSVKAVDAHVLRAEVVVLLAKDVIEPVPPADMRLDNWFLGVARAGSQPPTPVPFFPEVHEELTGTWKAPFTARNRAGGPSLPPLLMAVWLRVTRASPLWSGPLLCSCALTPPGAGSRLFLPGPVSTRRTLPAGLTRPVGKPLPPYTLWRCCRSIRPRH